METQNGEIHGHDVMQMMLESDASYDDTSLEQAICDRFGTEARFYTCSASGMTAQEIVKFLADRGKFVSTAEGFTTAPDKICKH